MSNFSKHIIQLRKAQNLSQEDLANLIDSSRVMIGKYERGDNMPSVEVIIKIAKALNVSLDFLIGEGELSAFDKDVLKRIEDIERLDTDTKNHLFFLIDNVIQNYKTKQAFAK